MINFLVQAGTMTGCKNLIGGLLMGAATLFATPETPTKPMSFDASVYVNRQGKIRLSVEKTVPGVVWVQLLDQHRQILFSNTLRKKELKSALLFDVSQLTDGAYVLEIKSAGGSILKQINVATPVTPVTERTIAFR